MLHFKHPHHIFLTPRLIKKAEGRTKITRSLKRSSIVSSINNKIKSESFFPTGPLGTVWVSVLLACFSFCAETQASRRKIAWSCIILPSQRVSAATHRSRTLDLQVTASFDKKKIYASSSGSGNSAGNKKEMRTRYPVYYIEFAVRCIGICKTGV